MVRGSVRTHVASAVMLLLSVGSLAAAGATEPMTSIRVFRLEHRSVAEASQMVQPMLSEDGRLTVEPRRSTLTVQDRPDVVSTIAAVLQEFDREPDNAMIVVRLFEASPDEMVPANANQQVPDDLVDNLKRVFKSSSYRLLGAAEVNAELGEVVHAALGDRYVLQFLCLGDSAHLGVRRVRRPQVATADEPASHEAQVRAVRTPALGQAPRFKAPAGRFRLQHLTLYSLDPQTGDDTAVLQTSVALSAQQRVVLSAAASEDSGRGLVLVLENASNRDPS